MRLKLLLCGLLLSIAGAVQAQKLSGKVINTQNEPVAGASVKISNTTTGTSTNQNGIYNIRLNAGQQYEIEVSAIGYETKIIGDVEIKPATVTTLDVVLEGKPASMEGVIVSARRTTARMETAASVIQFQKNTNTVASVVSAETIRRSPDKNTGDVLKRTPGASLQDGKFLIVRGLADRYNTAMLNGILLTSTEPDRKTFAFNLIPSAIIDNIIINKAFVPEHPGEWSGGLIQVNTKDIPTRNFLNVQIGTGFNTQTVGKDFYKSQGGKLDWLGIDDGARALPSSYKTKTQFDALSREEKTAIGKELPNTWVANKVSAPMDASFQV
ncbi:MAG TPA: carboxypeptidase-like regulatory domain-containing protein, partial [Niabella sp.]|nr:carboxypeptidase-like regulatory domain-containing protein [Niabella sp.]